MTNAFWDMSIAAILMTIIASLIFRNRRDEREMEHRMNEPLPHKKKHFTEPGN